MKFVNLIILAFAIFAVEQSIAASFNYSCAHVTGTVHIPAASIQGDSHRLFFNGRRLVNRGDHFYSALFPEMYFDVHFEASMTGLSLYVYQGAYRGRYYCE